ncbi:MAG: HAD family phosphatase [Planctomycetota bacterium]
MPPSRFRAVIFDLGAVLIGLDWSASLERMSRSTPLPREAILPAVEASGLVEPYEEGRLSTGEFCVRMRKALKLSATTEEFVRDWNDIFARRPEMETLFLEVRRLAPVAILSDTCPLHWERIREFAPPLARPDFLGLSYEIGSRKPCAKNYLAAAQGLGVRPEACVFLDDREGNVRGARLAGMEAFTYTSPAEARARVFALLGMEGSGGGVTG